MADSNSATRTVLWIGIGLIAMMVVLHWSELSGILFGSTGGFKIGTPSPGNVPVPPFKTPKGGCPPNFESLAGRCIQRCNYGYTFFQGHCVKGTVTST